MVHLTKDNAKLLKKEIDWKILYHKDNYCHQWDLQNQYTLNQISNRLLKSRTSSLYSKISMEIQKTQNSQVTLGEDE